MLVIYYLSDFRNEPEISAAWENFIRATDAEAVASKHSEAQVVVQEKVRALGKRVQCSEIIFNPRKFCLTLW
jgi:hypothetical protein